MMKERRERVCVCECVSCRRHATPLSHRNAHLARLPGRQRKLSLQGLPASFHVTTSHLQRQDSLGLFFSLALRTKSPRRRRGVVFVRRSIVGGSAQNVTETSKPSRSTFVDKLGACRSRISCSFLTFFAYIHSYIVS